MEKHFTATAYVLQPEKVLLLYHPKLKKWLPPGGHIEANETPPDCAKREVWEETGLEIAFITQENVWLKFWNASSIERPYLCLLENIPSYKDRAAHQHIDFIFLARPVGGSEHPHLLQNRELAWFRKEEILALKADEEIFKETQCTLEHIFAEIKI